MLAQDLHINYVLDSSVKNGSVTINTYGPVRPTDLRPLLENILRMNNLAMVQVGNFPAGACQPTPVHALRVFPPAERVPVFLPIDTTGCAGNPPGPQLRVSSVKPGAGPA